MNQDTVFVCAVIVSVRILEVFLFLLDRTALIYNIVFLVVFHDTVLHAVLSSQPSAVFVQISVARTCNAHALRGTVGLEVEGVTGTVDSYGLSSGFKGAVAAKVEYMGIGVADLIHVGDIIYAGRIGGQRLGGRIIAGR